MRVNHNRAASALHKSKAKDAKSKDINMKGSKSPCKSSVKVVNKKKWKFKVMIFGYTLFLLLLNLTSLSS